MINFDFLTEDIAGEYFDGIIHDDEFDIYIYKIENNRAMIGVPKEYKKRKQFFWNYVDYSGKGVFPFKIEDTPKWFQEIKRKAEKTNEKRFRLIELYE